MKHILHSLSSRERTGTFQPPPLNIRMKINTIIPKNALQSGGHIIMGFSSCGRYLLSYTTSSTSATPSNFMMDANYIYKLYFWRFTPFKLAKKIKSVTLFDRNGIPDGSLLIHLAQTSDSHVVAYARSSTPEESPRCYISVLSTPVALNPLVYSTCYDLVQPYPVFDPQTNLLPNIIPNAPPIIFINTGNMLHMLDLSKWIQPMKSHLVCTITPDKPPSALFKHYDRLSQKLKQKHIFNKRNHTTLLSTAKHTTIYDLNEKPEPTMDKNFSQFRRRALAEKRYEFIDNDDPKPTKENLLHLKSSFRINRTYVLLNDDTVSTTTEIEDDTHNPYPVALPFELYNSDTQLSMIPNAKLTSDLNKVKISQATLDIELLSNDIANFICKQEQELFTINFLIDFDILELEALPDESIFAIVVILIQGRNCLNDSIEKYETSYMFQWSPSSNICNVFYKSKLKQVRTDKLTWNPTSELKSVMCKNKFYFRNDVTSLHNTQMIYEWTSVDELRDVSNQVIIYREPQEEPSDQPDYPNLRGLGSGSSNTSSSEED